MALERHHIPFDGTAHVMQVLLHNPPERPTAERPISLRDGLKSMGWFSDTADPP